MKGDNMLGSIKKILLKFSKDHTFIKNVDGVIVLVLSTSSDNALYLYHMS